jgi:hypothetical protein
MERVRLLTVEHTFWLSRDSIQMLILSPDFPVPNGWRDRGWNARTEAVTVLRPDGTELAATAQINMTHLNIPDPDFPGSRWRITVWLTDRTKEEVPVGSKILVSPEVRTALRDAPEAASPLGSQLD